MKFIQQTFEGLLNVNMDIRYLTGNKRDKTLVFMDHTF